MNKGLKVALIWDKWGPYHFARYKGFVKYFGSENSVGLSIAGKTNTYQWEEYPFNKDDFNFKVLLPNDFAEKINIFHLFIKFIEFLKNEKIKIVFLPSYWPLTPFVLLIASKIMNCKCIMMNESHAGTEKAKGWKLKIKILLVKLFDGALLGGKPQIEYFTSLGMNPEFMLDGYDVVDNDYYYQKSLQLKNNSNISLNLPNRFILNLGRMVPKKNLQILIRAYNELILKHQNDIIGFFPSLVLVGSGEELVGLQFLCNELGLNFRNFESCNFDDNINCVYFYGFRQIDENPNFFSKADVFVLPSLYEEWGLVVNESLASQTPVIVSNQAGCSNDLVEEGVNGYSFNPEDYNDLAQKIILALNKIAISDTLRINAYESIKNWSCDLFGQNAKLVSDKISQSNNFKW
jgi:glycosyltransferase involved in cell wall biosynthesis